MISLKARITLSASLVLVVFVALTALALERAFRDSATTAMRERLQAQLYLVMADTEVDGNGQLQLPEQFAEPRLNLPGSGLYARISNGGELLWHSHSALGIDLPALPNSGEGEFFGNLATGESEYFLTSMSVTWNYGDRQLPLRFSVAENTAPFEAQLSRYRTALWGWLGGLAALLVVALTATLAWGLRPLRTASGEIHAIEAGQQERIESEYPAELKRLTDNINTLLHHERSQQGRYKNALADLAHSLKTPLAILRGLVTAGHPAQETLRQVEEQVARMDGIVQYQLQRAATAGRSALLPPLPIAPTLGRLLSILDKVYHDKTVKVKESVESGATFRGEEGDLMELLGNLLDNAFKYGDGRVHVSVQHEGKEVRIAVEDNGPGIPAGQAESVLARGVRLDEGKAGHGIGLPVVRDIVEAYGGRLHIDRSAALGGCAFVVWLPA